MRSADARTRRTPRCLGAGGERGIALVVAIVALVVIGAIVAGTFFVSSLEQKTAVNAVDAAQAYQAAEAGIVGAVANWDPAYNELGIDASVTATRDTIARGVSASVTVSRLNPNLFLVRSVGTRRGATQTLASVLRLVTADPHTSAAVTTASDVSLTGGAEIDGASAVPPDWSSCSPAPGVAGVRTGGRLHTSGHASVVGTPATIQDDSTSTDAALRAAFDQLARAATVSLSGGSGPGTVAAFGAIRPSVTGSPAVCNRADPSNWGEPARSGAHVAPCTGYSPVVYIDGNARIDGPGRGQGVLLVRGNLSISGGFAWVGLVLATGQVKIADANGVVTGALIAHDVSVEGAGSAGNPAVAYSRCALDYALRHAAVARPLATRAWVQMF